MRISLEALNVVNLNTLLDNNRQQIDLVYLEDARQLFEKKLKNTDVLREHAFENGVLNNGVQLIFDNGLWCVAFIEAGNKTRCAYFLEHSAALRYLFLRVTKRAYHAVRESS